MIAWIVNIIFIFLPPSPNRLRWLKVWLLRCCGHKVASNVGLMRVRVQGIKLSVGEESFIGDETMIMGASGTRVVIGKRCDISSRVNIITGTHKFSHNSERCAGEGYGEDIYRRWRMGWVWRHHSARCYCWKRFYGCRRFSCE